MSCNDTATLAKHLAGFLREGFEPAEKQHVLHVPTGLMGPVVGSQGGSATLLATRQGEGLPFQTQVRIADCAPLTDALGEAVHFWRAEVAFCNGNDTYGGIEFDIAARDEQEAETAARHAATLSAYDDDRIPDRSVSVEVEEWPDMLADLDVLEEMREALGPR